MKDKLLAARNLLVLEAGARASCLTLSPLGLSEPGGEKTCLLEAWLDMHGSRGGEGQGVRTPPPPPPGKSQKYRGS